jgi:hypothetical protein
MQIGNLPAYRCATCHQLTGNPHTSLDRRIVRRTFGQGMSPGAITLNIWNAQELFCYCGLPCWAKHEPAVCAELKLTTSYPPDQAVTPCGRCGSPVLRALPHVVYAVVTTTLTDGPDAYVGQVLAEVDFAILCPDCDEPDPISVDSEAVATAES